MTVTRASCRKAAFVLQCIDAGTEKTYHYLRSNSAVHDHDHSGALFAAVNEYIFPAATVSAQHERPYCCLIPVRTFLAATEFCGLS